MEILFVTFGHLSVGAGANRSVSILRALADAGHQVDVVAAGVDIGKHPNVRILVGLEEGRRFSRGRLRRFVSMAMRRKSYHAVHAVDDAVLHVVRLGRLKKVRLVYEASRCFSGSNGDAPSWFWRAFPTHCRHEERRVLRRADMVLTPCGDLSADLKRIDDGTRVVEVEDVPVQSLYPRMESDRNDKALRFDGGTSFRMACIVLPGNRSELRTLLLAARKVVEQIPQACFFFKGVPEEEAQLLATNLDILNRCRFFPEEDVAGFLRALAVADAALFVPPPRCRYPHPEILTLLNSPALVVAIHEAAYAALLDERNSVQVDYTAASIAEGLMRVVQEPLLAFGIVAEAQRRVAERYSFSSFKHRIRMAYHELDKLH